MKSSLMSILLCTGIIFSTQLRGSENKITPNTSLWIHTYMCNSDGSIAINQQDLQALLNLLYISFDRSRITLIAQEDGLPIMQSSWHTYQNIIKLRRNPSKYIPNSPNKATFVSQMSNLYDLQLEHRRIGKTYATAIESIVKGSLITNQQLKNGILSLRNEARKMVATALTDVKEYLDLIMQTKNGNETIGERPHYKLIRSLLNTNFNLGDYVWALIPNLALNSFIQADDMTIDVSEEWSNGLYQLLTISNMIWKPIEKARAGLYLTYYKAIYNEAQSQAIDMKSMRFMFNEFGILDVNTRTIQLPVPSSLQTP